MTKKEINNLAVGDLINEYGKFDITDLMATWTVKSINNVFTELARCTVAHKEIGFKCTLDLLEDNWWKPAVIQPKIEIVDLI